jgi:tRNA threonylcarbamoyl adenosine modification protein YjeE
VRRAPRPEAATATTIALADDAATTALGARLAALLRPGELVTLSGELGAGKTTLARAILRALAGDPELEVPSPTFALVQPYSLGGRGVLHADLYRLREPREVDELGLFDDPGAIVLVEWAERAPGLHSRATIEVSLAIPPDGAGRTGTIAFADARRLP